MTSKKSKTAVSLAALANAQSELAQMMEKLGQLVDAESPGDEINQETLEVIGALLANKVDNITEIVTQEMEAQRVKFEMAEKLYATAKKQQANRQTRLKEYVKRVMEDQRLDAIPGVLHQVKLQNNSAYSVEVDDDQAQDFTGGPFVETRVDYKWNKKALLKAWQDDPTSIPSCVKVTRGKHLRFTQRKV
jgi:hypothetical protein